LSDVTVSDILDSNHLIVFHILDHVTAGDFPNRIDEFTVWDRFSNLASGIFLRKSKLTLVKNIIKLLVIWQLLSP